MGAGSQRSRYESCGKEPRNLAYQAFQVFRHLFHTLAFFFFGNLRTEVPHHNMMYHRGYSCFPMIYSWIPFAPAFPAPIARITVAAPVTASPPAYTPSLEVFPNSSSAMIHFLLFTSSP